MTYIEPTRLTLTEANSPRLVLCEACGSEGRIYVRDWCSGSWNEPAHWGERDDGECPWCEGTGGALIATDPITLEDVEAIEAGEIEHDYSSLRPPRWYGLPDNARIAPSPIFTVPT